MAALILFPVGGGVISPCLSLFVTVRRRQRIGSDSLAIPNLYSVSGGFVLGLPFSISVCLQAATKSWDRLEDTINPGYNVLSRYRKCGEGWDLERTIEQFERALNVCPLDHLCRAAARSNLEMTDFTRCLVEGTGPFHDVSLGLYRDALTTHPIGNFGRPSTLIRLAAVHLARFDKRQDKVGAALAHENVNLSSAESWAPSRDFVAFIVRKRQSGLDSSARSVIRKTRFPSQLNICGSMDFEFPVVTPFQTTR